MDELTITKLLENAVDRKPDEFRLRFEEIMRERVTERVENLKRQLAESLYTDKVIVEEPKEDKVDESNPVQHKAGLVHNSPTDHIEPPGNKIMHPHVLSKGAGKVGKKKTQEFKSPTSKIKPPGESGALKHVQKSSEVKGAGRK